MKKIVVVLICFFTLIINVNARKLDVSVKFKSCIDGDTATFIVDDKEVKVRFLSINTPEFKTEYMGEEAKDYTCKALENADSIILEHDDKATVDKYDRLLAWIWVDGKLLQESLVSEGLAEVAYVYDDYKYTKSLCLVENEAMMDARNIWSIEGKEEDYCAGIDLEKVTNNIDFSTLILDEESSDEYTEEELELIEELKKYKEIAEKFTNGTERVTSYLDENEEEVSNFMLFVILGMAGLYLLLQMIKTFKESDKK